MPAHKEDASFYTDWGDPREFTIGDLGMGECAGEIVSLQQFGFTPGREPKRSKRSCCWMPANIKAADEKAYQAMLTAAKTLVQIAVSGCAG